MAKPVPVALTEQGAPGRFRPQPLAVADVLALLSSLPGYDVGEVQTLTNDEGVLTWVTAP